MLCRPSRDKSLRGIVSWSFAALQRNECEKLSCAFRFADMMLKEAMRHLVLAFAEQQLFSLYKGPRRSIDKLRHTCAPPQTAAPMALMVDASSLTDADAVGLTSSLPHVQVLRWRVSFRITVDQLGRKHRLLQRSANLIRARFNSLLKLQENCLSVHNATKLALDLLPAAVVLEKTRGPEEVRGHYEMISDIFLSKLAYSFDSPRIADF
jgi:hypothetical protein